MAILRPCPLSSNNFEYDSASSTFTAEASTLGRMFRPARVYDDAADEGFTIVSTKTGGETVFAMDGIDEVEGEFMGWRFVAVKYPKNYEGPKPLRVLIIND